MSNKNLFNFAGWSAILSVVFSFAMFAFVGGGRGGMFMVVSIIASFFSAVVFYALYVLHRPQSSSLSMVMFGLAILGLVLENIGTGPNTPLGVVTNSIYGVAFILAGYLGFGSSQMPRWIAICAFAAGVGCIVLGMANAIGQASLANVGELLQFVAWIAWSVGILLRFSFSKAQLATA
ncbi:MAG TPA: hypothetical protein PK530_10960 [Anaerolineales bacterium]|nr:hypothetical protein [Anaerolineales bacterium]